jgi:hypothetical protein
VKKFEVNDLEPADMDTEGDLQTMLLNNSDSQDGDDASYHGRIQEQKHIKKGAQKNRWSPGNR